MSRRSLPLLTAGLALLVAAAALPGAPAQGVTPKRGGVLNTVLIEDPPNELRQRCVGTGPFRQKEYLRGQLVEMEHNPDYFVPGRPYLDGIRYTIVRERGTRLAALQAGRLDAYVPLDMTRAMADTAKAGAPKLVITEIGQNGSDNILLNHKRAPFDNPLVRRAVNLGL